jgi:hypothetical protein
MQESTRPLLATTHCDHTASSISAARNRTRRCLNSKLGHYAILLVVSLDCSCIFAEFIIQIFTCEGTISKSKGRAAQEAVSIIGLVFSCLFMLELLASIWAFGFR